MSMANALERNYSIEEEIGRGKFGVVYKCSELNSGDILALKTICKKAQTDPLDAECFFKEPKILRHIAPHPHVIQLRDLFEDEGYLHVITDLCPRGDVHSLLCSLGPFSESRARPIFRQIMLAISHCHRSGVVHRDIKPENVLLDSRGDVKLADFGSAEFVSDGGSLNGVVGTPSYVAPEILKRREYGAKVDVWSAGVLLYVMVAGCYPFNGDDAVAIFEAVLRGNLRFPTSTFSKMSPSVKDLLRKMICKDVSRRFSADQVIGHSWILHN